MDKLIRISLEKTINKNTKDVRIKEHLEVPVLLELKNINSCELVTNFDNNYLTLKKGKKKLKLKSGTYHEEIVFLFEAIRLTRMETTWISFEVRADDIIQCANLPIIIK